MGISYLSGRGVLLQPVVDLGHHRGVRRLHCAAQGEKKTKTKAKTPFIHLGRFNMGANHQLPDFLFKSLQWCFFFFLTFSALTGSGTLPSLQSVTGGKTRQHSSRLINTAPIFHTGKPTLHSFVLGQQAFYFLFLFCLLYVCTLGFSFIFLPGLLSARTLESKQPLIGERKTH